jgi:mono/diheme cytochrome c family protein
MKRLSVLVAGIAIVAFAVTASVGAEGGNSRKGKHLYKKTCKVCHVDGAEGGELTPLSKTQSQWDRWFKKKKAKHNPEPFAPLSDQDVLDVHQFLYDHAADSDQPETCG